MGQDEIYTFLKDNKGRHTAKEMNISLDRRPSIITFSAKKLCKSKLLERRIRLKRTGRNPAFEYKIRHHQED